MKPDYVGEGMIVDMRTVPKEPRSGSGLFHHCLQIQIFAHEAWLFCLYVEMVFFGIFFLL